MTVMKMIVAPMSMMNSTSGEIQDNNFDGNDDAPLHQRGAMARVPMAMIMMMTKMTMTMVMMTKMSKMLMAIN